MPVTYTNRQGVTYYLCQTVTKTGKPRYRFTREPAGDPVEHIPEGWKISESVNGVVSLVKDRPVLVLPEELAAVEAAVGRHPRSRNYRVAVQRDRVVVYERVGPDAEELAADLGRGGWPVAALADRFRAVLEPHAQFTPVLRFILIDAAQRTFCVERWCYLGGIDDWIPVGPTGPLERLARQWIPRLGTDAFFEVLF